MSMLCHTSVSKFDELHNRYIVLVDLVLYVLQTSVFLGSKCTFAVYNHNKVPSYYKLLSYDVVHFRRATYVYFRSR